MTRHAKHFAALLAIAALSPAALAQLDNQWLAFVQDTNRIKNPDGSIATLITNNGDEKHFAIGDFNNDGWTDLAMVTKIPSSIPGMRRGYLMMNENGTLVDRSLEYATDADVGGSFGLFDTSDYRKVQAADLNGDGLLDLVTCSTNVGSESSNPKYLSHPRVYINKGFDVNGAWLGFRYEEARIPTLLGQNGQLAAPRFCSIAAGDVTGDGFVDLYAVQYHDTETGYYDNVNNTDGDRLLVNDGNGYFTDSGTTRMTQAMLDSHFGTECKVADMNGDGTPDIVKDSTRSAPINLSIAYNSDTSVGTFDVFQQFNPSGGPYHIDVGDLNNDGRLDAILTDDGADRYMFNTGNDALGRVVWSPAKTFAFVIGADESFGGENHIADLDGDGWADAIISDVDHDILGCSRHARIYHNPGGVPGSTSIQLVEEAGTSGWRGAEGIFPADVAGTYDEAVFDLDNDGDMDIVFARCAGTSVFVNQESACSLTKYGDGVANSTGVPALIDFSGTTSISHDHFVLKARQAPPLKTCLFIMGTAPQDPPVPFGDGVRWIGGTVKRMGITMSDTQGDVSFPAAFTAPPLSTLVAGDTRYFMLWYRDPAGGPNGFNGSNALAAPICP